MAQTVNDLIEALGGNDAVCRIAGVGRSAVSNWRRFGCFPPRLFLRIAAAANERGVDVDSTLFREMGDRNQPEDAA